MKKLISILLALIMLTALAVPVLADVLPGVGKEDLIFAEYAEVGDGVYFDTKYITGDDTVLVMDVNIKNDNETWFGEKKDRRYYYHDEGMWIQDYSFIYFTLEKKQDEIWYRYGEKNIAVDVGNSLTGRHTIQLGFGGFYLDKTKKCQSGQYLTTFYYPQGGESFCYDRPKTSLYLFGTHITKYNHHYHLLQDDFDETDISESVADAGNVTFYNCRIYDKKGLVHYFVPAVIKSNNKASYTTP